jgi:chitodextrinase
MRGWLRIIEVDSTGEHQVVELLNVHRSNYHNGAMVYVGFGQNGVALLSPVWDQWFKEYIAYDPVTGVVRYTVNDTTISWTAGKVSGAQGTKVRIDLSSYGWYTGNWTEYESIELRQ